MLEISTSDQVVGISRAALTELVRNMTPLKYSDGVVLDLVNAMISKEANSCVLSLSSLGYKLHTVSEFLMEMDSEYASESIADAMTLYIQKQLGYSHEDARKFIMSFELKVNYLEGETEASALFHLVELVEDISRGRVMVEFTNSTETDKKVMFFRKEELKKF